MSKNYVVAICQMHSMWSSKQSTFNNKNLLREILLSTCQDKDGISTYRSDTTSGGDFTIQTSSEISRNNEPMLEQ